MSRIPQMIPTKVIQYLESVPVLVPCSTHMPSSVLLLSLTHLI